MQIQISYSKNLTCYLKLSKSHISKVIKSGDSLAGVFMGDDRSHIKFTVSIGVATLHEDDSSIEAILNRADKVLYNAKKSGRNCVVPCKGRNL